MFRAARCGLTGNRGCVLAHFVAGRPALEFGALLQSVNLPVSACVFGVPVKQNEVVHEYWGSRKTDCAGIGARPTLRAMTHTRLQFDV